MPIAEIELSNGRIVQVEFEGEFNEQAIRAAVDQQLGLSAEQERTQAVPVPALTAIEAGGIGSPAARAAQAQPPTSEAVQIQLPGALGAFLVGAGDTLSEVAGGAQRLVSSPQEAERLKLEGQESQRLLQPLREEFPVSSTIGAVAPALAIPGGTTLRGAAAIGSGLGVFSQSTEDQAQGGVIGAAAGAGGNVAGRLIGRAVSPLANEAGKLSDELTDIAKKLGVRLTAGQRTGSRGAELVEQSLRSSPAGAGAFERLAKANQTAINRAAARSIGSKADDLSNEVIDKAFRRLGKQFEKASRGVVMQADDTFREAMNKLVDDFGESAIKSSQVSSLVGRATTLIDRGEVKGEVVARISSQLGRAAGTLKRSQPFESSMLMQARKAVDDLMQRNLGAKRLDKLREARGQYRNLVTMVDNRVVRDGNVNMQILANVIQRLDPRGLLRGKQAENPLYQVAKLGRGLPQLADSGTASRLAVPLTTAGIASGAAYGLSEDQLAIGAALGLSPLAMQALVARLMTGGRGSAALSNQLVNEATRGAIGGVGAKIGAGAAADVQR